jgi:hypothetical protein
MKRLMMLCKQSYIINKKLIAISVAGFAGTLFLALVFFQFAAHFRNWDNKSYEVTFAFLFLSLGIIFSGLSFPAFRSKEKTMAYLMLPASSSEKFVFELLTRIVLFMLLMPLTFWIVANLEGVVVHYFVPELVNYKYSFHGANTAHIENQGWISFVITQGILFGFLAPFMGASHFTKSPLMKTMFAFPLLATGYGLFTLLLVKGLGLEAYHMEQKRVFFIQDFHDGMVFLAIMMTIINLTLLSVAWFRLKEKEA